MTDSVLKDTVNALRDKLVVEDLRQPGKVKFPLVPALFAIITAQKGHKGANINLPHKPDEEVEHFPEKCRKCPCFDKCRQNGKVFKRGECRYELNAVLYVKVTRHQVIEVSSCPRDDTKQKQKMKEAVSLKISGDTSSMAIPLPFWPGF